MSVRISAGKLNKRVTLCALVETSLGGGLSKQTLQPIATRPTVHASVQPLSTSEQARNAQLGVTVTHQVEIRYRSDVTPDIRLKLGSRVLVIVGAPVDVKEAHVLLRMTCREEVAPAA